MTSQNLDYYRQRADEELAAAEQAHDPTIAQIHREMARRYLDNFTNEVDGEYAPSNLGEPMGGAIAGSGPVPA